MLNRLYIIIGMMAIILLLGAFFAPLMIDWNSYRDRMEFIAEKALGQPVKIKGNMSLSLLPQPKLNFSNIIIGKDNEIIAEISNISAKFSLLDFFRDKYIITDLLFSDPKIFLKIDKNGQFVRPLNIPKTVEHINLSINNAKIENGSIELFDDRIGEKINAKNFFGELSLAGLNGPFTLSGEVEFLQKKHKVKINSSTLNENNELKLLLFSQSPESEYILKIEGLLNINESPKFAGNVDFRLKNALFSQREQQKSLGIRGDLIVESQIKASLDEILFREFTIIPDENLPATRLTGAASIELGSKKGFSAVISGGIISLGINNHILNEEDKSFAILQILRELPNPPLIPINGQVGVDILELDLGKFSLRNIRLDARTDGKEWFIDEFSTIIAPNSLLRLSAGRLTRKNGRPIFSGNMLVKGEQAHLLAKKWRFIESDKNLLNIPFSLTGEVRLSESDFSLDNGQFDFAQSRNNISFNFSFAKKSDLNLTVNLGKFDKGLSGALIKLLPDLEKDNSFSHSFSALNFNISAAQFFLLENNLFNAQFIGKYNDKGMDFKEASFFDETNSEFRLVGQIINRKDKERKNNQQIFGQANINLASNPEGKGVPFNILRKFNLPTNIHSFLRQVFASNSLNLTLSLSEPGEKNKQELYINAKNNMNGKDKLEADLSVEFMEGIFAYASAPLKATINANISPEFIANYGAVFSAESILLNAEFNGAIMNSLGTKIKFSNEEEQIEFNGDLIVSDLANLRGKGELNINLHNIVPLIELIKIKGFEAAPFAGKANLNFSKDKINLRNITGKIANIKLDGEIERQIIAKNINISGTLNLEQIRFSALAGLFSGNASLVGEKFGENMWPDGLFSLAKSEDNSRLNLLIRADYISKNGKKIAENSKFEYIIDNNNVHIRDFSAKINDKNINIDLTICCSLEQVPKQISGHIEFSELDLADIFGKPLAKRLKGVISASIEFSANGNSYAEIITNLAGEGTVRLDNVEIFNLNPNIFEQLEIEENVENLLKEDLEADILALLNKGSFGAKEIEAIISITGGNIRASNIIINEKMAQLFGNFRLNLADFTIFSNWVLTPKILANTSILLDKTNAKIGIKLEDSLFQPKISFILSPMIDGLMVKALEMEVDRLEKLRQEADERSREAARIRLNLMQEQARILEQKRREEEEKRLAAEAAKAAEQEEYKDGIFENNLVFDGDSSVIDLLNGQPILLEPIY